VEYRKIAEPSEMSKKLSAIATAMKFAGVEDVIISVIVALPLVYTGYWLVVKLM